MAEVRKAFKREIPLPQRDDWEGWLAARRAELEGRTAEIVRLETQLNARVYALFDPTHAQIHARVYPLSDLTSAEIRIIEESTKYRYGEV
jgi:hypothetical protein